MTALRSIASLASAAVRMWLARLSSTRAGVVLVYHRVGGAEGDEDLEILPSVSREAFERQLRHLQRRYRVVEAAEILQAAARRRRGDRFPVAITFDDDLASHVRVALPALRRRGLPAMFFLTGASLEEPHSFWWDDLQRCVDGRRVSGEDVPYVGAQVGAALAQAPRAILEAAGAIVRLTPAERGEVAAVLRNAAGPPSPEDALRAHDVRALGERGCKVGFHTLRHDALTGLSDDELERALRDGRDALAAAAGHEVRLIAYPHGRADARVAEAALRAGFALGFTTSRGVVTPDSDPLLLPRTVADLSPRDLAARLARAFGRRRQASGQAISSAAPIS